MGSGGYVRWDRAQVIRDTTCPCPYHMELSGI